MCTMIATTSSVTGAGKGSEGWFALNQMTVAYDHSTHTGNEHALLLDFANYGMGPSARVAVELDLASARALLSQLAATIDAAARSGVAEPVVPLGTS